MTVLSTLALLGALMPTHAAEAQLGRIVVESTRLECVPLRACDPGDPACDGGRSCEALPDGSHACSFFDRGFGETLCCSTDADCGSVDGVVGRCAPLDSIGVDGPRVCIWRGILDYCVEGSAVVYTDVTTCLNLDSPGTYWADGDCDGDGIKNGPDECPCNPDDFCGATPPADGGVPIDDGGVVVDGGLPVDAGMPWRDGAVDSGGPVDSGRPLDSAVPDTGTEPPPMTDAAASDDGGSGSGVSFTGDGGCATSPGQGGAGALSWLLVGLALVLRRRRS